MRTNSKIISDAYAAFVADDNKAGWCAKSFFKAGYESALSQQLAQVSQEPYAYDSGHSSTLASFYKTYGLNPPKDSIPLYSSPPGCEALKAENEALKLKLAAMEPKP